MTPPPDQDSPDDELRRLVSGFIDDNLDESDSHRLQQRLRDDPAAREFCARSLRFDATLQEALDPRPLEWEETRRVVFDPKSGSPAWSIQRQQTVRYGHPSSPAAILRARWPFLLALGLALIAGAAIGIFINNRSKTYHLRNGDFEAMDLSQSPSGIGQSLLYWQDNFTSHGTVLCEIGRVSGGSIFARSGRNVARIEDYSFINQLILNKMGNALKAKPGTRVRVDGWAYCGGDTRHALRGSLRFVASAYPDMIQYEAADTTIPLQTGGWRKFSLELVVPKDLRRLPSDLSVNVSKPPPSIDLEGKELTLSLDSRSPGSIIYLDDLSIHVRQPEN